MTVPSVAALVSVQNPDDRYQCSNALAASLQIASPAGHRILKTHASDEKDILTAALKSRMIYT